MTTIPSVRDRVFRLLSNNTKLLIRLNEEVSRADQASFCIQFERPDLLEFYLTLGLRPDVTMRGARTSLLNIACESNQAHKIVPILLRYGANPKSANDFGWTPLHDLLKRYNAICNGDTSLPTEYYFETLINLETGMRMLLQAGAELTASDSDNKVPFDRLTSDSGKERIQSLINEKPATRLIKLASAMGKVPSLCLLTLAEAENNPELEGLTPSPYLLDDQDKLTIVNQAWENFFPEPTYASVNNDNDGNLPKPEITLTDNERVEYNLFMQGKYSLLLLRNFGGHNLFYHSNNRTMSQLLLIGSQHRAVRVPR